MDTFSFALAQFGFAAGSLLAFGLYQLRVLRDLKDQRDKRRA